MSKKISVFSQGCAANFGDGEQIARLLESRGYQTTFGNLDADAFCLNVCTVKGESTALQLLHKIKEAHPTALILLTGCIPQEFAKQLITEPENISLLNLDILRKEPELLDQWLNGKRILGNLKERSSRFFAKGISQETPHIGILNISDGCLDACSVAVIDYRDVVGKSMYQPYLIHRQGRTAGCHHIIDSQLVH